MPIVPPNRSCFPTGLPYPGIAAFLSKIKRTIPGLSDEFDPSVPWFGLPLIVIDFETTGTDPHRDRIIEIGLACFSKGILEFSSSYLIDPHCPIPEQARAIHGICDQDVIGKPDFKTFFPTLREKLQSKIPVAYNAAFDRSFLLEEFKRMKSDVQGQLPPALIPEVAWIDPLIWARELLQKKESKKLSSVAKELNIPLEHAHRAENDAKATGYILYAFHAKMPKDYRTMIQTQRQYMAAQQSIYTWKRNT